MPLAAGPLLRDELRPFLRSHLRAGSRRGRRAPKGGASRSPRRIPTTAAKPPRPSGTSSPASSRRWSSARTFEHPRDVFPRAAAHPRPQHGQGRRRDGGVGSLRAQRPASRCRRSWAARATALRPASRSASRIRSISCMEKVDQELAAGYQRIKIKIKPGWDIEAVERIRAQFGDIPLQVDANAAYTLDDAALLARLDPFDLLLIEQPLDYDDVMDHVALQRRIETPMCLDESIHTVRIARDAIAAKACRIINIKPGRVGGHQHVDRAARPVRRPRHSGVARRHARKRHRPRAQHPPREPAQLPPAGRHRREQALLPARPDRAGHRHRRRRHHRRADGPGHWRQHRPGARSTRRPCAT